MCRYFFFSPVSWYLLLFHSVFRCTPPNWVGMHPICLFSEFHLIESEAIILRSPIRLSVNIHLIESEAVHFLESHPSFSEQSPNWVRSYPNPESHPSFSEFHLIESEATQSVFQWDSLTWVGIAAGTRKRRGEVHAPMLTLMHECIHKCMHKRGMHAKIKKISAAGIRTRDPCHGA